MTKIDWKSGTWYLAGHNGLAGMALHQELLDRNVPEDKIVTFSRSELDLRQKDAVFAMFEREKPDYVLIAAAVVGGIEANRKLPVPFLKDNLEIQNNIIEAAYEFGVQKLLFLGSSCIYPRNCPQPMKPEHLLSGPLEPTNEWYAIAKIAGIKLCQAYFQQFQKSFISVMPTNMYGPGDNYHLQSSHVLPALIRKFHEAVVTKSPTVTCWGDGSPLREFLFSKDFANACLHAFEHYNDPQILNIGSSREISIKDLAEKIAHVVGFQGEIIWDTSMPNGTPRKLMDSSVLQSLGWKPSYSFDQGITLTYQEFIKGYRERAVS